MIVNEGINEGVCEKKRYQVLPGDILFINPGEIHTGNSYQSKTLRYSAFYIETEFFTSSLFSNYRFSNSHPTFMKLLATYPSLVEKIKTLFISTLSGADRFDTETRMAEVFGELMLNSYPGRFHGHDSIAKNAVDKAKNFIKDQYNQQLMLAHLTDFVGISPFHLIRCFKQEVGLTPFQFLRNYRVEVAKQELLKKKSITEVAVDVGFYDQSHFHKYFKLVTGLTPATFQRLQQ